MKIFISSDLHLLGNGPGGDNAVIKMADYLQGEATAEDVLLLIGDLGQGEEGIESCLSLFSGFPGKKVVVLGNHDLWEAEGSTTERYRYLQEELIPSFGFHSLDREPFLYQGLGFVGSIGWYDYSLARAKGFEHDQFASKRFPEDPKHCWQDVRYIRWGKADEAVVQDQHDKLAAHLKQLEGVSQIIVAMHHVPTRKLLPGFDFLVPRVWGFMNAFLGSTTFSDLFADFRGQIKRIFCGHVHNSKDVRDRGVSYSSVGGDYRFKELLIYDPHRDVSQSLWFS